MDEENIIAGTPPAGSPEVRDALSDPMGIADIETGTDRPTDVAYDDVVDEMQHGRFNEKTRQFD